MRYVHSETFNALKQVKEEISSNLTSSQYLTTLDHLIWNGLSHLKLASPLLFRNYFAKCVAHQSLSPNTKFSPDTKAELPLLLFNALTTDDEDRFKKLRLNRGLLFGLSAVFLDEVQPFVVAQSGLLSKSRGAVVSFQTIESLQCPEPDKLWSRVQEIRYWNDRALWFKSLIIQKYMRMALLHAQKTYVRYGNKVSLDDTSQIHMMIVSKAIDRCSSNLGVITTFIKGWLKSATTLVAAQASYKKDESLDALKEEYGDSFDIPVEPDTLQENIDHISYIAKTVDEEGLVRTVLGIPQHVTLNQRLLLETLVDGRKA